MTFSLSILGSNSALPTSERYPTAQVLNVSERFFLIDCGEGTQMRLRQNKIKFSRINQIFISHLHGDHCFGLIGLISTYGLLGRTNDLEIFAHEDLKKIMQPQLDYFCQELPYKVHFRTINPAENQVIYQDEKVSVETIPLKHRIPTCGFLFREKPREPKLNKFWIEKYNISLKDIIAIKQGADYVASDGEVIKNEQLTIPARKPRSFAYCSDTKYTETILPFIKDVDLLYHEATFLDEKKELAKKTTHTTAAQAARIAEAANVHKLVIGHFSSRYKDVSPFKEEAQAIFANTELAIEGAVFDVK